MEFDLYPTAIETANNLLIGHGTKAALWRKEIPNLFFCLDPPRLHAELFHHGGRHIQWNCNIIEYMFQYNGIIS
jgi:hypothetical protein